jgi:hypothetical protein
LLRLGGEVIESSFRNAVIDGGKLTLWVRIDRIVMAADVPLSPDSDRIVAERPSGRAMPDLQEGLENESIHAGS